MLVEARKAVRRARLDGARVNFIEADVLDYEFPFRTHDAVATHFFLDCFAPEQLEKVVTRIAATLAPGGAWLLADFHLPPQGVQRWRVAIILKIMYVFFRAATGLPARTLANPDSFLERNGLVLIERHLLDWGLLHSDLWRKPQPSSSQQLKTLLPKLNLIR